MQRLRFALGTALLLASAAGAAQTGADPFVGRWTLDPSASTYPDHRCRKSMVIQMSPERGGIHYHSETVPAGGETFHVDYVARYDGKPAILTGDRKILLPVALSRDGTNRVRAVYTSALR